MNEPALVLLPGLDGTGELFAPLLPHLAGRLAPIVVRYPLEPRSYAELLPLVLEALPRDRPFTLLGESFSGPLAVMAAATNPAGLTSIVLDATFVQAPRRVPPSLARWALFPSSVHVLPSRLVARVLLGPGAGAALQEQVARVVEAVPGSVSIQRILEALAVDVAALLPTLPVPILYLRGSHDRLIPRRHAEIVRRLRPDTTVVDLDCGHMVLQRRPGESAEAILQFLATLPGRARPSAEGPG